MVFIVGQTEQASEKAKLLQQLAQVFFKMNLFINENKIVNLVFC